ncbi:MAG: DUF4097 family beta strand repeat protein [Clostridia bacterium]|nr:DUF4097 family beta strand repeat protein [Clostridia bacterium]
MKKLIALILVFVFALCFCGCTVSVHTDTYPDAEKYSVGDAEFAAETIKSISIDYVGDVDITLSDTDKVTVTETTKSDVSDDYRVHTYVDDGTLLIKYCKSGLKLRTDLNTWQRDYDKNLKIELPKDLVLKLFDMDLAAGNAIVEIPDCETVDCDIAAGELGLKLAKCSDFDLDMAAGECKLVFDSLPKTARIDMAAGDVDVAMPKDASLTLTLDKVAGGFNSDIKYTKDGDKYVFGDGDNEMEIDCVAGDVSIMGK